MLGGPQAYHWADCVAVRAWREGGSLGEIRDLSPSGAWAREDLTHPQHPHPSLELTVAALASQALLESSPIHARFRAHRDDLVRIWLSTNGNSVGRNQELVKEENPISTSSLSSFDSLTLTPAHRQSLRKAGDGGGGEKKKMHQPPPPTTLTR